MYNKRATNIKNTQQENKKLQQETKRLEEELQRIKKLKAMELEKERLRLQMERLQLQNQEIGGKVEVKKQKIAKDPNLRNYGEKVKQENERKMKGKISKMKIGLTDSQSEEEQENDTENLKYFMTVVGFPQYFEKLVGNDIKTLGKLREVNEQSAKKIGIPLKDMVKINKKLRSMGY